MHPQLRIQHRTHGAGAAGVMHGDGGLAEPFLDIRIGLHRRRADGAALVFRHLLLVRHLQPQARALDDGLEIIGMAEEIVVDARRVERIGRAQQHLAPALLAHERGADAEGVLEGRLEAGHPQMRIGRRAPEHIFDVGIFEGRIGLDEGEEIARQIGARPRAEEIGLQHGQRHAVKAHQLVEMAGAVARPGEPGRQMVLQIGSHGQIDDGLDPVLLQMGGGANAREHEQLRCVEGAGGNDDLLVRIDDLRHVVLAIFHAHGARALEDDAGGLRLHLEAQIGPTQRGMQMGSSGRMALAVLDGLLYPPEALGGDPVEILVLAKADRLARLRP